MHRWRFFAVVHDGTPTVVNVCKRCGEARAASVRAEGGAQARVDVTGVCEGKPSKREQRAEHQQQQHDPDRPALAT
jgi:hypothetical protein